MKILLHKILIFVFGILIGVLVVIEKSWKYIEQWKMLSDKHLLLLSIFSQWISLTQSGKTIKDYFCKHNYKRIIIYGMGYVGECLYDELYNTDIKVVGVMDKNEKNIPYGIPIISFSSSSISDVDCIVVTSVFFYDEIYQDLSTRTLCPIISFEDVVFRA